MLGLGLGGGTKLPPTPPFGAGTALAIDFAQGLAARGGASTAISNLVSVNRTTPGCATDSTGSVDLFAANTLRRNDVGLHIASRAQRLHGQAPTAGWASGGSATVLAQEGPFSPRRITSGGAGYHLWEIGAGAVTTGQSIYLRVRYRAGTSGKCRIYFGILTSPSTLYSYFNGPVGALFQESASGGTFDEINQVDLGGGVYELSARLTISAGATDTRFGVGSSSPVNGETVDVLGMQATDQYSDWIFGGSASTFAEGDDVEVDLSGLDLSSGFVLQLDATLSSKMQRRAYARLYEATPSDIAYKLGAHLNRNEDRVRMDHFYSGSNYGGSPIVAGSFKKGRFRLVCGHGGDFVGGGIAWAGETPSASPAPSGSIPYSAPTRLALAGSDGLGEDIASMSVQSLRIYAQAPSLVGINALVSALG